MAVAMGVISIFGLIILTALLTNLLAGDITASDFSTVFVDIMCLTIGASFIHFYID